MILPDKIKKGHFVDLKKQRGIWEVRISPDDPPIKEKRYKLPKWLSDEIDYKLALAEWSAVAGKLSEIQKVLGVQK